jgi:RNA polymerase sigma-70 factor (ECF subfamily)
MRPTRALSTARSAELERPEGAPDDHVRRLFDAHSRAVLTVCRAILRDAHEAEDAAQQTFLSAYRALLAGVRPRDEAAWIAAIARNECRGRIRGRMAEPACAPLDAEPRLTAAAVSDAVELSVEIEELCAALRELPRREREALTLRELRGFRYDEVAAAMGIRVTSVEPLLWRGRRRLRQRPRNSGALVPTLATAGENDAPSHAPAPPFSRRPSSSA